ncbi:putative extracellular GDSL-like lipase/acylhydrolase [Mycena amicta]|nr:putative extracellular GDSL-like lipase/acylhydrolase [Mycena amicta]
MGDSNALLTGPRASFKTERWVNAWATMPQLPDDRSMPPAPFTEDKAVFVNTTIRQTMTMSLAGSQIRVRLSNACGTKDLVVSQAAVALPLDDRPGARDILPNSSKVLTFDGATNTSIPPGALIISDPIDFAISPRKPIALTIYLKEGQDKEAFSCHPGSRTTAWFMKGNQVLAETFTEEETVSMARWYFLGTVETIAPDASTFVIVGDSICDGGRLPSNVDHRWTDFLLARMISSLATPRISISNLSAAGNCILMNRTGKGPNLLSRLDRDVLSQSGINYFLVCSGLVDIRQQPSEMQELVAERLIAAYKQIILRVHAIGVPVFAGTITPAMNQHWTPERERARRKVNAWIRGSGAFDAVIDFDRYVADPEKPESLRPELATPDLVHPNVDGYRTMANAFPLELFTKFM